MAITMKEYDSEKLTMIKMKNSTKDKLLDMKFDFRVNTMDAVVQALIANWEKEQGK